MKPLSIGPLSIGKAWEETVAFVKLEGALLFPVAFLFLALPVVIFQQMIPPDMMANLLRVEATGAKPVAPDLPPSFWIGFILVLIVSLTGALTLYALALRPGISVSEAMRLSLRRLPVLMGAGLIVGAATMLAMILLSLIVALFSFVGGTAAVTVLVTAAVVAVMIFASVRLLLLNAVAIDRPVAALAAVKQSWALTRGQFWRLFAFLALFIVLSVVAQTAVQSIFGVIGGLAGGATIGVLVAGLAVAALSAVLQVYFMVMTARIYRQLEGMPLR